MQRIIKTAIPTVLAVIMMGCASVNTDTQKITPAENPVLLTTSAEDTTLSTPNLLAFSCTEYWEVWNGKSVTINGYLCIFKNGSDGYEYYLTDIPLQETPYRFEFGTPRVNTIKLEIPDDINVVDTVKTVQVTGLLSCTENPNDTYNVTMTVTDIAASPEKFNPTIKEWSRFSEQIAILSGNKIQSIIQEADEYTRMCYTWTGIIDGNNGFIKPEVAKNLFASYNRSQIIKYLDTLISYADSLDNEQVKEALRKYAEAEKAVLDFVDHAFENDEFSYSDDGKTEYIQSIPYTYDELEELLTNFLKLFII